ncbi:diheme cytochrome c SoxD [Rhodobacterales bacterium HTCC2150]|nr:diheme cytochrome c SoxD [Rhodobacterales bacterium HTCC2150] [Rhodobacteraceae bacterium HTCC2150]
MSKFLKSIAVFAVVSTSVATPVLAEKFGLGRVALPEEIAAWDQEVRPDGTGLPVGSGDAIDGEEIFADKCASCHGDFAEGIDNWPKLAGGADTLDHEDPLKTVGSYWPYLSTTFDYVKRSMPFGAAGTLTDDEVYAITAYILYSNDMIEDDFVLSNETFFDVDMPNAAGFIVDDRATTEYPQWSGEPCMENCKTDVKITMRALVLDVTPNQTAAEPAAEAKVEETAEVAAVVEEVAAVVEPEVVALDEALVAKGKKTFKKCKACHKIGEGAKNGTGPLLNGVVGATAGAVEKFKYSKAMASAGADGLVWTPEELHAFLTKPKAYMKKTKMSFNGLKKESDRNAVIEYLKSFGE